MLTLSMFVALKFYDKTAYDKKYICPGGGATHGLAGGQKSYECVSRSPNVNLNTNFGTLRHSVLFVCTTFL